MLYHNFRLSTNVGPSFFNLQISYYILFILELKMYRCKNLDCDEQFKYSMQLLRHKKKCNKKSPGKKYTHENNCFVCSNCHRSFTYQSNVTRHVKNCNIKTNVTHVCPKCDKIFLYKSRLIKHILSHTEEESKSCKKCGKTFRRRDYCTNHTRICKDSIDFIPKMSNIIDVDARAGRRYE